MKDGHITLADVRLHYHEAGHGPDILLLHGWSSSRRMWWHLAPGLAQHYRVWALDLPGFGDSDKPPLHWYSIPNFTAAVREFMRAKHIEQAHIVGHSMGGLITFDFAATHPELTARVVAINPVVSGRATLRPLLNLKTSRQALELALRVSPAVFQPVLRESGKVHPSFAYLQRRFEDFSKGTTDSILASGRAVLEYDITARLPHIHSPTLVIVGRQDVTVSNEEGRLAVNAIPDARLSILWAGHHPTDDVPAKTLQLVEEFLA